MRTHKTLRTTFTPFVTLGYLVAFCIVFASPCSADTSEPQRVGVERKDPLIISPGIAVSVHDSGEPDDATRSGADLRSAAESALTVNETFSIDITYRNVWNLFASIPCTQIPSLNFEKAGAAYTAWGDPDMGAGRSFRFRDWKIEASMRWTFPFGIWNAYEAEAKSIRSGSGYHRLNLPSSFTRFMDPVALVIGVEAETTIPRKERFGTSREPLAVALPAAITWAANSRLALQTRLVPGFSLPPELNDAPVSPVIGRSLYGSLTATLSGEKNSGGEAYYDDLISDYLPTDRSLKIYLDCGDQNLDAQLLTASVRMRDALVATGYTEGADLQWNLVEGAGHNEAAWAARVPEFLKFLHGIPKGN